MNQKWCQGTHDDKKNASWIDTGGATWHELVCNHCGRLKRERA